MLAKRSFVVLLLIVAALLAVACGAPAAEPGAPVDPAPATPEAEMIGQEAAAQARAALAEFLGVSEDALTQEAIEAMEWSDGCLGLGGPAELCLAAITPGYAVTFLVDGEPYVVRTDLEGNAVRVEAAYAGGEDDGEGMAPDAAIAAMERLAAERGIALSEVQIVSWSAEEWTDSCLGLGGPAESCLQAITPGYLVVLALGEELINVRTDESGEAIRFEDAAGEGDERPATVDRAVEALAEELGAAPEAIEVLSFERAEWSDGCLGLGGPAESCLQAITPGWRVMLGFEGSVYEVRTDESGQAARVAGSVAGGGAPLAELGNAALLFVRSGGFAGGFTTVRVFEDGSVERIEAPGDAVELFEATPAAVSQLLADLQAAGYFELEGSYLPADPCCDRFSYLLSVRGGDGVHTVETVEATEDVPQAVWDSMALVEAFVEDVTTGE